MIYFTADWHLGHENIIKYCNRPFKSCKEMEDRILSSYRDVVNDEDTVYLLGDIFWYSRSIVMKTILDSLPGRKILIKGNHDKARDFKYIDAGFSEVYDLKEIEYFKYRFLLNHDPAFSQINRNAKFLCGHVHDLFLKTRNVLNVGVDVWDFKLVSVLTAIDMLYYS